MVRITLIVKNRSFSYYNTENVTINMHWDFIYSIKIRHKFQILQSNAYTWNIFYIFNKKRGGKSTYKEKTLYYLSWT